MNRYASSVNCLRSRALLVPAVVAICLFGCNGVDPSAVLPSDLGVAPKVDFRTLASLPDSDNDGLPDLYDPAPNNPDMDADGVLDGQDADTLALITIPDTTDPNVDSDSDGLINALDADPLNPDANGNGILDGNETDSDGDGLVDAIDHYPSLPDANCNGILDGEDPDYDNTVDYPSQIRGGEIVCGGL
jgi:hypothetical protein